MGNQKFKLSDMIPNAWFYKLKDMSKPSKTQTLSTTKLKKHRLPPPPAPPSSPPSTTNPPPPNPEPQCQPRKSYHFTRDLTLPPLEDPPLTPPRKSKSSSKSRKSTKKNTSSSISATSNCRAMGGLHSHRPKSPPLLGENVVGFPPKPQNASPKKAEHFDIVIDVDNYNYKYRVPGSKLGSAQLLESLSTQSYKINGLDFHLPRIVTKPSESPTSQNSTNKYENDRPMRMAPPSRRFSVSSPAGVRLKINSPKIMPRKQGQNGNYGARKSMKKSRRSISESFAVVKSSDDPQKDFKESMVEMIVQNNLRGSKDLEDLLACYLSLNSDEYHDDIIKVFKQIWFDLSDLKQKKFVS